MYKKKGLFKKKIEIYRKDIDKIDDKIIKLLDQRGKLVQILGDIKKKYNLDIYQPERENEIIERIKTKSKILDEHSIESIWRDIITGCKLVQAKRSLEKKS